MRCGALTAQAEETLRQYALEPERLTGANLGRYEKGEPLCMEGGPIEHLLILLEGRAKVSITTEEGNSLLTCFYHGGGVVGDLELLTGQKTAGTNVIVQVPIRCIRIPIEENRSYLKGCPDFLWQVGLGLGRKLERCSRNSALIILYPLETRLCSYIGLTQRQGVWQEQLTETAELLGASYRHLMRQLRQLCAQGILCKEGRCYRIADRERRRLLGRGFSDPVEGKS